MVECGVGGRGEVMGKWGRMIMMTEPQCLTPHPALLTELPRQLNLLG